MGEQDDLTRVREIADRIGFVIEEDFRMLAGITPSTCEAWRKRGSGPAYVLMGCRYFYPLSAIKAHLEESAKKRGKPVDLL